MPSPDPKSIRQAVEQFQPRRRLRFQKLVPWSDEILALRAKGASCGAIAELLSQHGVPTSRTMVTEYLAALPEVRPGRRRKIRHPAAASGPLPQGRSVSAGPAPVTPSTISPVRRPDALAPENAPAKTRGPRIAQVELLDPNDT
jgi:hypothetical protein